MILLSIAHDIQKGNNTLAAEAQKGGATIK